MKCSRNRKRIHAWLDHPGTPMPEAVREHIRACGECREFIRAWNAVELSMQAVQHEGPGFEPISAAAIYARLEQPAPKWTPDWRWFPRFAMAGFACLLLVALVLFFHARGGAPNGAENLANTASGNALPRTSPNSEASVPGFTSSPSQPAGR